MVARHKVEILLFVLVLAVVAPIVQPLGHQQASRMALTGAIWDDGTIRIDGYPLGLDFATHDGNTYSDKAPGQSVLAVPAYALYRAAGGEPAREFRRDGNLGLWMTSVWTSAVPAAVVLLVARRVAARAHPRWAVPAAMAATFSTLVLPFGSLLFGHVLATALALGGWAIATRDPPSRRDLAIAGLLLGAAVLTEYTLAFAAVATAAHVLYARRQAVLWVLFGALPTVVLLLLYQWAAFGNPFSFSYASSGFGQAAEQAGLALEDRGVLDNGMRVLFGDRGLFLITPVVALGAVGIVLLIRSSHGASRSANVAAAATAASLVMVQIWWGNPTGGDSPGARYATAAGAFLVGGIAHAWSRWPTAAAGLAGIGAALMLLATWTDPLVSRDATGAIGGWFEAISDGEVALTTYEMAFGHRAAWLLLPGSTIAILMALRRSARGSRPQPA